MQWILIEVFSTWPWTGFLVAPLPYWTLIEALRSLVIFSLATQTRFVAKSKRRLGLNVMLTFFLDLALTIPL